MKILRCAIFCGVFLSLAAMQSVAQRAVWRQATAAELASVLPSRAPVENEHIETEMRTASGIVDEHGRFIAGVVLITAGYSAEGKYSHYLIVQAPVEIGGVALKPGEYAFGWSRADDGDTLSVHFNQAGSGALVGTTDAHRIAGSSRVESLRIWPPGEKGVDPDWAVWDSLQTGRRITARRRSQKRGFQEGSSPPFGRYWHRSRPVYLLPCSSDRALPFYADFRRTSGGRDSRICRRTSHKFCWPCLRATNSNGPGGRSGAGLESRSGRSEQRPAATGAI